jgi:DNA-binding transcriptional LysR family regulator
MWVFVMLAVVIGLAVAARRLNWRRLGGEKDFGIYSEAIRERHALSACYLSKLDRSFIGIGFDGRTVVLGDPSGERTCSMSAVTGAVLMADGISIAPDDLARQKINKLKVRISVDDVERPHYDYLMFEWPNRRAINADSPYVRRLVAQARRILERFPSA